MRERRYAPLGATTALDTRVTALESGGSYLPLTGGTLTGNTVIDTDGVGPMLDLGDGAGADNDSLLRFNIDRPWSFRQWSTGAGTALQLYMESSGDKQLYIGSALTDTAVSIGSESGNITAVGAIQGSQLNIANNTGFKAVTGTYGAVQTQGSNGGYGGISLDGNFVLMNSGSAHVGLYDDINNEWLMLAYPNAYVSLYGNGTECLRTISGGGVQSMNGGFALSNTSSTSRFGIGLYGSADTDPTYGIMFTSDSEHYGGVNTGWATVFTMDNTAGRGWKFNNQGYGFAVAAVENTGEFFGKSAAYIPNQSASVNFGGDQVHYAPVVPGGTYNSNASTQTGYLRINMPTEASGGMMQFTVRGYDYSSKGAWAVNIAGYEYIDSNAWVNESIRVLYGTPPFDIVYMGKATGSAGRWILFGTASLTWNYPQIAITDFVCGYSGQDNHLISGDWTVDFSASVPTGWASEYSLTIGGQVRWEGESGFQAGGKMSIQSGGSASGGSNGDIIFIY